MSNEARPPVSANGIQQTAGGYGPPGGGYPPPGGGYPPPGGGGYGGPPAGGGGAPPGGYGGFGAPPGGGFGPAGGFPPPGGPMMPGAGGDVNTTLPLILNIVAAVLCGGLCVTFVLSILGIVFAVQGGNAKNSGDITTARAKAKASMQMFIITIVLGVVAGANAGVVQLVGR